MAAFLWRDPKFCDSYCAALLCPFRQDVERKLRASFKHCAVRGYWRGGPMERLTSELFKASLSEVLGVVTAEVAALFSPVRDFIKDCHALMH